MPEEWLSDEIIGAEGLAEHVVTEADTAVALGSGDVAVLGTPKLLAVLEAATSAAVADCLPGDFTTVGVAVDITHRRPTPVGARVQARASVVAREGRRLVFDVEADHETASGDVLRLIAQGRISRVVVERASFGD